MKHLIKILSNSKILLLITYCILFLYLLNRNGDFISENVLSVLGIIAVVWFIIFIYIQMWKRMKVDK